MTTGCSATFRRTTEDPPREERPPAPEGDEGLTLCESARGVALQQVTDLHEQLLLGGQRLFFDDTSPSGLTLLQLVHGKDEREVDHEGDREELDDRGEDRPEAERRCSGFLR